MSIDSENSLFKEMNNEGIPNFIEPIEELKSVKMILGGLLQKGFAPLKITGSTLQIVLNLFSIIDIFHSEEIIKAEAHDVHFI